MARYSKQGQVSDQTKQEAMQVAKGIQKPGQTKEQTKLIAQGIQKGIELYKKQQKALARERDKAKKKSANGDVDAQKNIENPIETSNHSLPWTLLALSWGGFIVAWIVFNM